jgi:hypothetical protein
MAYLWMVPYHEFTPGRRIQYELYRRLRIEGFVIDRIPSFMFGSVDIPPFVQHHLCKHELLNIPLQIRAAADPKMLYCKSMFWLRSANEMIINNISTFC